MAARSRLVEKPRPDFLRHGVGCEVILAAVATRCKNRPVLALASIADIPQDVQAAIRSRLDEIERAEGVRVVLAVESGSRAWGFASPDSDYDIRFLYVRRVEDYAALFVPRDVIELPMEGLLDFSGWDLRKALSLGLSWNPALIEWLTSPITYREEGWEADGLRRLFARPLSRDALIRHCYGLAGHFGDILISCCLAFAVDLFFFCSYTPRSCWRGDFMGTVHVPARWSGAQPRAWPVGLASILKCNMLRVCCG